MEVVVDAGRSVYLVAPDVGVIDYLLRALRGPDTDLFLETNYADRLRASIERGDKQEFAKTVQTGALDNRVVSAALNLLADMRDETTGKRDGRSVADQMSAIFRRQSPKTRVHCMDIRYEPLMRHLRDKVRTTPGDGHEKLTSESRLFLRRNVPNAAAFQHLFVSFLRSKHIVRRLNRKYGAEVQYTKAPDKGMHKLRKSLLKLPEHMREAVLHDFGAQLSDIAGQYDNGMRNGADQVAWTAWRKAWRLMRQNYVITRSLAYALYMKHRGNTAVVSDRDTLQKIFEFLQMAARGGR
jgi:hypothetical protein